MARLKAANNAITKLTVGITAADTSFTVKDATLFPDAPFRVTIDAEIMQVEVIDKLTNTFSAVQRGLEGTVAAPHNNGAEVANRWTAGYLEALATLEESQAMATTAESEAKTYADGAADTAETNAKTYATGLIGTLGNLLTTAKDNIVAAINELKTGHDAHLAETVPHPNLELTDTQHGILISGELHAVATTSANGFMSSLDKQQMEGNSGVYTISYVDFAGKATKTYTIPIGYAAARGRLALVNTDTYVPKGIAWFSKVANDATGISGNTVSNRGIDGRVLYATNIYLQDVYISGTSLKLTFYNASSSTYGLGAKVCWEVT